MQTLEADVTISNYKSPVYHKPSSGTKETHSQNVESKILQVQKFKNDSINLKCNNFKNLRQHRNPQTLSVCCRMPIGAIRHCEGWKKINFIDRVKRANNQVNCTHNVLTLPQWK